LVCVGLRRIVTVAFLRRVQIFLLTYLLTFRGTLEAPTGKKYPFIDFSIIIRLHVPGCLAPIFFIVFVSK